MIAAIYSIALSTLLFAQPNDDLAQQIERARQAVKDAQAKLDDAEERVDRLQKQQDAQRDRARLLLDDAQRIRREAEDLERRLEFAKANIVNAQAKAAETAAAAEAAKEPARLAAGELRAAASAIDAEKARMVKAFEASEGWQDMLARAVEKQSALQDAITATKLAIANDPKYIELKKVADEAKARVTKLRETPNADSAALAQASQTWMSAQSAAGEIEAKATDTDPAVKEARRVAAEAERSKVAYRSDFEATLTSAPKIKELQEQRVAAAAKDEAAQRALSIAARAAAAAANELAAFQRDLAGAATDAAARRTDAAMRERQAEDLLRQSQLSDLELQRARQRRDRARLDVQEAARKLRELLEK